MNSREALRRLAAVAVIGLIAATGCSTSKTASQQPPSSSPPASSSAAAVGQPVDLTGLDQSLSQLDDQVSGANAGISSTSEGDVQTQ
jgi:hypothetical protein